MISKLANLAGYRCARCSASGQRRGRRKNEKMIPGDIIAWASNLEPVLPHLLVEVGGVGKRVRASFVELTEGGLPAGHRPLVARCLPNRRWRFYCKCGWGAANLLDLLEVHWPSCDA